MPPLIKKNDNLIFQGDQDNQWNNKFRIFKNKIFGNSTQYSERRAVNIEKNEIDNSCREISDRSDEKIKNSFQNNTNILNQKYNQDTLNRNFNNAPFDAKYPEKISKQKRIIQLMRRNKAEEFSYFVEKKITLKDFSESIDYAHKLGEERIIRAEKYYRELLSNVKQSAINEASNYIINHFDECDMILLLSCISTGETRNSFIDNDICEIYLLTKSRILENHIPDSLQCNSEGAENINTDFSEHSNIEVINNLNPKLLENELSETLSLIGTSHSNIESSVNHLVSRVCDISLEINKTAVDFITKDLINFGKYKATSIA
ncbi:hypothetical protein HWI79_163 [Cryptosporidium felis]|nr:hypothetical protein HWI79_163 [Cryptosporidium felis]